MFVGIKDVGMGVGWRKGIDYLVVVVFGGRVCFRLALEGVEGDIFGQELHGGHRTLIDLL